MLIKMLVINFHSFKGSENPCLISRKLSIHLVEKAQPWHEFLSWFSIPYQLLPFSHLVKIYLGNHGSLFSQPLLPIDLIRKNKLEVQILNQPTNIHLLQGFLNDSLKHYYIYNKYYNLWFFLDELKFLIRLHFIKLANFSRFSRRGISRIMNSTINRKVPCSVDKQGPV